MSDAVEPLDLDGGLPDVYYAIRSRNDEWTTATGPVPRSTYLMDTEVLLLLVARLGAALTTARQGAWDEGYSHLFDVQRRGGDASLDDNPYRQEVRDV